VADGTWEDLGSTDAYTLRRLPVAGHPTGTLHGTTVMRGFTPSQVLACVRDDGCRRVWDRDLYDHTEFRRILSAHAVLIRACMKGKVRAPAPNRPLSVAGQSERVVSMCV
jgi:hypothetical protein